LKSLAEVELRRQADVELKECLMQLSRSAVVAKSSGITSIIGVAEFSYNFKRRRLEEYGVWNPAYNEYHHQALNGELDVAKLFGVKIE
jgi:hypothetical protein